jgi:hypothetical protein
MWSPTAHKKMSSERRPHAKFNDMEGFNPQKKQYYKAHGYLATASVDPPPPCKDEEVKEATKTFYYFLGIEKCIYTEYLFIICFPG